MPEKRKVTKWVSKWKLFNPPQWRMFRWAFHCIAVEEKEIQYTPYIPTFEERMVGLNMESKDTSIAQFIDNWITGTLSDNKEDNNEQNSRGDSSRK